MLSVYIGTWNKLEILAHNVYNSKTYFIQLSILVVSYVWNFINIE